MHFNHAFVIAAAALSLTACAPAESGDEADAPEDIQEAAAALDLGPFGGVLIPQPTPLTQDLYKLGARSWLTWVMALPYSTGPITDTTGAACGQGQSGPVWFLAGTDGSSVTRNCTIPGGKLLFFPLINNWVIARAEQVATPEQLAHYKAFVQDYLPSTRAQTCELHLSIDGVPVGGSTTAQLDQKLWTQVLNPFGIEINADNFASQFGFTGGYTPAATIAGHFAMISPLSTGHHVVEIGGSACDDTNAVTFSNSVVYHLTVQ